MPTMKLTDRQKNQINAIITAKTRVLLEQEAIKDDVAALAIDLGLKPGKVSELITLIMAEQGKGGVIEEKGRILDMAEQVAGGGEEDAPTDADSFRLEVLEKVNDRLNQK